jgi:hypothetical protein
MDDRRDIADETVERREYEPPRVEDLPAEDGPVATGAGVVKTVITKESEPPPEP